MFLCRRLPELSREEYARRILGGHVPLALRHHPTMRRYTVNIVRRAPEGSPELDSIAALSFDRLEDFQERLYDSEEGRVLIGRDVRGFMAGADAYATREHVLKDELAPGPLGERTPVVKWISMLQRRPQLSREQFAQTWLEEAIPTLLRVQRGLVRYVANTVDAALTETGERWDGFAEMYYGSLDAARQTADPSSEVGRTMGPISARYIGRGLVYSVAEYVQKR